MLYVDARAAYIHAYSKQNEHVFKIFRHAILMYIYVPV